MHQLSQRFYFDAAHTLNRASRPADEADSSKRIHGHTYWAELLLEGVPDAHTGMVVDLGLVRQHIEQLRTRLDHVFLDELPGLGVPTLENLCSYILSQLQAELPALVAVRVWRDSTGDGCTLRRTT